MSENPEFTLKLQRKQGYQFEVSFDWPQVTPILLDEPEPLGQKNGANASRLLGAAVGNCLSASLLFCLEKAKIEVSAVETTVRGHLKRNERGRLRVGGLDVDLVVDFNQRDLERIRRCLNLFEEYCIVSASVKPAIPINVSVRDRSGQVIFEDVQTAEKRAEIVFS